MTGQVWMPLTKGFVTVLDESDLCLVNHRSWSASVVELKDCRLRVYAVSGSRLGGRTVTVKLHRVILGLTNPSIKVDHVDGDGLNNSRSNLRIATTSENAANRSKSQRYTSPYKGVSKCASTGMWRVDIRIEGRRVNGGRFYDDFDAALEYDRLAVLYFDRFARLNFPEETK